VVLSAVRHRRNGVMSAIRRSSLGVDAARHCCLPRRDTYQCVAPSDVRNVRDAGSRPQPPFEPAWVAFCRLRLFNGRVN
jgi:hypothetical protein